MTENSRPRVCPQCAQDDMTRRVSDIARDEADTLLGRALAAPRSPGVGNTLGCATLFFSMMIAISVSMIATALTNFTSSEPPGNVAFGLRQTAVFAGVVVFMFTFVAVYAFFVWRQARSDTRLRKAIVYWHVASERWQQLYHCARCDGVFMPGRPALTPTAEINNLLYAEEPAPPSPASARS